MVALFARPRTWLVLALAFLALSALDAITTLAAIRTGHGSEQNPLMGFLMTGGPLVFVGGKMTVAAVLAWRFSRGATIRYIHPATMVSSGVVLAIAVGMMAIIPVNNLLVAAASPWSRVTGGVCEALIVVIVAMLVAQAGSTAILATGRVVRRRAR